MGKLVFAVLLAGAGLLVPPAPKSLPFVVEVRPATGERVVLRVDRSDSLHVLASADGLRTEGKRLVELVAPGRLEITAGEGELQLQSADPSAGFVLSFKRETAGVVREFEARGERATIRVRGSDVTVDAESMIMREVRAP
jgi:hypothetical protein